MGEIEDIQDILDEKSLVQLADDESPNGGSEPVLDSEKIESVLEKLKNVQANNGFHEIAHNVELSVRQVKLIGKLRKQKIAELSEE